MKTPTDHTLVISQDVMNYLIDQMNKNRQSEPAMSSQVKVSLCFDTDTASLVIDETKKAYQFSSYQECNGSQISF